MSKQQYSSLGYKNAGVDIQAADLLIERIKPIARRAQRPGVLEGLGGFGSLFELPLDRYHQPVLVSGTDGVGTKLKLAVEMGCHSTVGIDLVAMCANDIVVQGAEPLFFLDYFATGKLDVDVATEVIEGIGRGCEMAGAALVGGETAEMPGMYAQGDYDLAGFCVGIAEKQRIIDGSACSIGDKIIGIASSGPHSNGYSLIRKILETNNIALKDPFLDKTVGEYLIEPTQIYVKSILDLAQAAEIHALAHITGGGITENLPRVLPENILAVIDLTAWKIPPIFSWLQQQGCIDQAEMFRTFNCGVGMIACVAPEDETVAIELLSAKGQKAFTIGHLEPGHQKPTVVYR